MASNAEEFRFTWKIENFSCLSYQYGEVLKSAEFIVESVKNSKWCLELYPRGFNDQNGGGKDHISLFLSNMENYPLTVFSYLNLETTDGEFEVQKQTKCIKDTFEGNSFGFTEIISLASLYEEKHLYLPQDVLTVKCCIFPADGDDQLSNNTKLTNIPDPFQRQCFSITRIEVLRRSVTWPIKKISKLCENRGKTNTYYSNSAIAQSPSLKLSICIGNDSNECAQIEIQRTDAYDKIRLFVKCKITILTADKAYQNSIEDSHLFSLQLDDKWVFPSFIKIKNLTDDKYSFINDTLILQCDFAFTYPGTEYHVEAPSYSPWQLEGNKPTKENQLCSSIHHLYTSGEFSDVTIHADGKTFKAHKCVLCTRSAVFKAMFQNDMKEKDTNIVDIVDIGAETLERFLKFLYSDILNKELTTEEACNLYKAANKYQVDLLKKQCSILLLSALSVANVCSVLVLAEAHEDDYLTATVDNFMQYHFHDILNSEEWKIFMDAYPILSRDVMFKTLKRKSFL